MSHYSWGNKPVPWSIPYWLNTLRSLVRSKLNAVLLVSSFVAHGVLIVLCEDIPIINSPVIKELIFIMLCMALFNMIYVFKIAKCKICSSKKMNLLTCLILAPTIFTCSQTCIWLPKEYFPSCSYKYHRVNKKWE